MNTNNKFLPFSRPSFDEATFDEVIACIKSGWLATGPRVKQFEEDIKQYCKAPFAMAINSATSGLHVALKCMGVTAGDEVITAPMTFVATLNTIVHNGAKPILVDVDLATRNIDVNKIEAAITPKTKVIMPIHFAGIPADMDPIYDLAKKYNLRVLEDAAHAIGSYYKNKIIGSFGDTQIFSFHPNKVITSGEGGGITTRDAKLFKDMKVQSFHGIDRDAFNRNSKEGSQDYDVIQPGYKYNMMDLQAALGIHQLKVLEGFISAREKLVIRYREILKDWPELTLPEDPTYPCRITRYIFAPLINEEVTKINRDTFMQLMKEHNIGTGLHYRAAHLFTYYKDTFGYKRGDFLNAEKISDRIVSLPLFADMTIEDQDRVITAMAKIFNKKV